VAHRDVHHESIEENRLIRQYISGDMKYTISRAYGDFSVRASKMKHPKFLTQHGINN
jgi:hypothetical protein